MSLLRFPTHMYVLYILLLQWHVALGFSRYLVYMRALDIQDFSSLPAVRKWIRRGKLILVLWEVHGGAAWERTEHHVGTHAVSNSISHPPPT